MTRLRAAAETRASFPSLLWLRRSEGKTLKSLKSPVSTGKLSFGASSDQSRKRSFACQVGIICLATNADAIEPEFACMEGPGGEQHIKTEPAKPKFALNVKKSPFQVPGRGCLLLACHLSICCVASRARCLL